MERQSIPTEEILLSQVQSGNSVIFIGAGASVHAGLPSSRELINAIQSEFPNIEENHQDLTKLCTEIQYTQGYGLSKLYKFIQNNSLQNFS